MWICTNTAFLSVVHKDCAADELLVRARRQGDIESVFPDAVVKPTLGNDYLFRAIIKRAVVGATIAKLAETLDYDNFKNSVVNDPLHNAYNKVWHVMANLQPLPPYAANSPANRKRLQALTAK